MKIHVLFQNYLSVHVSTYFFKNVYLIYIKFILRIYFKTLILILCSSKFPFFYFLNFSQKKQLKHRSLNFLLYAVLACDQLSLSTISRQYIVTSIILCLDKMTSQCTGKNGTRQEPAAPQYSLYSLKDNLSLLNSNMWG